MTEVGKQIDFQNTSGGTANDNTVRLTASPGNLECTGTFTAPTLVSSNPRISMYLTTAQNISSASETIINYNYVDSGGMTNTVGAVTVAAGAYIVSAGWATTAQGADYLAYTAVLSDSGATKQHQAWGQNITCVLFLATANNISVSALQNSGTTRTLQTGKINTWLNIYKLA